MKKIFDIAKDSEKSWGVIAQGIDGNFEEIEAKMTDIPISSVKEIKEYSHDDTQKGYYYALTQGVGGIAPLEPVLFSDSGSQWECMKLPVFAGNICTIATQGGNNGRAYAITDESLKIIEVADANVNTLNEPKVITINENGYLYINNIVVSEPDRKSVV